MQLHECAVCGILDNDYRLKESDYCSLCDAWICKADIPNIVRRGVAMYKRKKGKLSKRIEKLRHLTFSRWSDDEFYEVTESSFSVIAAAASGTWTHIQDCAGQGTSTCVFAVNPTQHDSVFIFVGATNAAPALTVTDGASNSYTIASVHGGGNTGGASLYAYVAYILNAPANADKTITITGNTGYTDTLGGQFRNTGGTPVIDNTYGSPDPAATGAGVAIILPSFTPAVAGSLGFSGVIPNSGIASINSPWTLGVNANSATEYRLSMTASSTNVDYSDTNTADNYAAVAIVVKP